MSSTSPVDPPWPAGSGETSLADVTERLFARFDGHLSLTTIARVVRRCRRELDITHGPVLPEMVERLAHQRLSYLAGQPAGAQDTDAATTADPGTQTPERTGSPLRRSHGPFER